MCSAISGQEEETGTTSLLAKAVDLADNGNHGDIDDVFLLIENEHLRNLNMLGSQAPNAIAEAMQAIRDEIESVRSLLKNGQAG